MDTQPTDDLAERTIKGIGDETIWKLRADTAKVVGLGFTFYSKNLANAVAGDATLSDESAVAGILSMAGNLFLGIDALARIGNFYAACALMRQVAEIEYLVWNFNHGKVTPGGWLNSTPHQRKNMFSPREMLAASNGRFSKEDYHGHCEMGGHPVPNGLRLLGQGGFGFAQIFLSDVVTHGWRIWDEFRTWAKSHPASQRVIDESAPVMGIALDRWAEQDELYKDLVARKPNQK